VTCDVRQAATGNALSPTVDNRVRQKSRDINEAECSCRLASVSAGYHSSSHRYIKVKIKLKGKRSPKLNMSTGTGAALFLSSRQHATDLRYHYFLPDLQLSVQH